MTETHEAPSAPLMEVSPQNSQQEGPTPQRARMRGGREVKEWHEFDGPAPPHYQLPSYLQAMGVNPDRDNVSWNMTARGDHSHFSQRVSMYTGRSLIAPTRRPYIPEYDNRIKAEASQANQSPQQKLQYLQ